MSLCKSKVVLQGVEICLWKVKKKNRGEKVVGVGVPKG